MADENEIGIRSVWDTKDFRKGEAEYSRGITAATKETEDFNKTLLALAKGEKALKVFEKASDTFDKMTDAEKDAIIATAQLEEEQRKLAEELKKTGTFVQRYDDAMKKASDSMTGKFANGAISAGKTLSIGVTAPLVAAGAAGVKAFSDLSEAVNAANVQFGEASQVLIDYAQTAATSVGLSKRAFLQASVPIGAQLQNLGKTSAEAADWTVTLTQRAADMASVFNTDVSDALGAIQSALRGEANPIERYGVGLSAAAVQAYALKNGLAEAGKEMTDQQKLNARLALLMEQTARVTGDFANTADGLANSTRITKAQLEDAAAILGEKLIPIASKGVNVVTSLVDAFNNLSPAGQDAAITLAAVAAGVGPVLVGVGNTIKAYQSLSAALQAANISMKAFLFTAGAWTAAIALVVAAAIVANDTFKKIEKSSGDMQESFTNSMEEMAKSGAAQSEILAEYVKAQEEANRAVEEMGPVAKALAFIERDSIKNYQGLNSALVLAGGTYQDYKDNVTKAAIANGDLNKTFVETKGNLPGFAAQIDVTLAGLGLLTEEEYKAAAATAKHSQETQNASNSQATLSEDTRILTTDVNASAAAFSQYTQYSTMAYDATKRFNDVVTETITVSQVQFAVQGNLQKIYDNYVETLSDLTDEHDDLVDKKEDLIKKGYSPEGNAVKEVNDALEENANKQDEAKIAADEATKSLIYQTAVAGLEGDAKAQLELAKALGMVSEADYNLITATDEITKRYKEDDDLNGYTKAMLALEQAAADGFVSLDEIKKILDELDGKTSTSTVNIHTSYTYSGTPGPGEKAPKPGKPEQKAKGGPVNANQPYIVGERGPELFMPDSAGQIYDAALTSLMTGGSKTKAGGGGVGSTALEAFTDLDFSVLKDVQSQVQDALKLMIDAGRIGEDEANLLYQSLSDQLIGALGADVQLTDEFYKSLTAGLGDLGDEVAEITRLKQLWAEQEEVVTAAEEALAAAEEKGEGVEEAKAALLAAEEAENITEDKLKLLEQQLEVLKEQKDLEIEIKKAAEDEAEARRKAAEEAAEEARKAAEAAKKAAEDRFDSAKKSLEDAQKEMERIQEIEKRMAEDAEIDKAQSAVDAAKMAISEIDKAEKSANVKKNAAVIEYNKLLREGASPEVLAQQKAAIDAAQEEIDATKESKALAEEKLAAEQNALDATKSRIEESRKEADAEDFAAMKEAAIAELKGATVEYNRAISELRALAQPDMDFIQAGAIIGELTGSISRILGGGMAQNAIAPNNTINTLNMNMTNQISGGIDMATLQVMIERTIRNIIA